MLRERNRRIQMKIMLFVAVVLQEIWLHMLTRHYGALPIAIVFFSITIMSLRFLSTFSAARYRSVRLLLGGVCGYLGGCASVFAAEILLRGWDVFERTYPVQNLYWFPLISMGWAFGMIFASVTSGQRLTLVGSSDLQSGG